MTREFKGRKRHFFRNLKTYITRQRLGELLVLDGKISTKTLKNALSAQKKQKVPLGRLLIDQGVISKWDLRATLFKQQALRFGLGCLLVVLSFSMDQRANADLIQDIPAKVSLTSAANSVFAPLNAHPAVFETVEHKSKDLEAFTKWTQMFDRFDQQLQSGEGHHEIQLWRAQLAAYKGSSLKEMASHVNDLVNSVSYVNDSRIWGKSDHWATPVEFLTRRAGDCEDFAIAKYTALRAMGVPENRLRVAIVQDTVKDIPHAVLIVYTENGPYILDNQIKTMVSASLEGRYKPIYSINRTAWWLHSAPEATRVAAAY